MDLSTNQELLGLGNRYVTKNGSLMFTMKETYEETDITGNKTFNSLKTETNSNHAHDPSSLFQVNCTTRRKLGVHNSLFNCLSLKKAMDLRTHNRTLDGKKRTIFDDAEYFAKNYCYKLLPITFGQVDETIIQSEHNYSLSSLNSESELEEDCSRTMDYSQIKEKNYKRRRTKFREDEMVEGGTPESNRKSEVDSFTMFFRQNEDFTTKRENQNSSANSEIENSISVQPLDLSHQPLVQEEKTDHLRERSNSIAGNVEVAQPDSDKENVNSELKGIRVTITRPDEKENYQPCDLFLNDIARLVPWLIDKDCFEVDILDRTCDHHDEFRHHRLYYVISESTWRFFQRSNERVILTNDQSLGQPLTKAGKDERPSYLVFDQFSLAKCLADYCKEIGGCFEYTCVEDEKKEQQPKDKLQGEEVKNILEKVDEVKKVNEVMERVNKVEESKGEVTSGNEQQEKKESGNEVQRKMNEKLNVTEAVKKENEKKDKLKEVRLKKSQNLKNESLREEEKEIIFISDISEKESKKTVKEKTRPAIEKVDGKQEKPRVTPTNQNKRQYRSSKRRKESPMQSHPNKITTRSKSTSGSETSQKSDKPVNRKGRKRPETLTLLKESPKKQKKPDMLEDFRRKTRSGKILEEPMREKKRAKVEVGKLGKRRLRSRKASQGLGRRERKQR